MNHEDVFRRTPEQISQALSRAWHTYETMRDSPTVSDRLLKSRRQELEEAISYYRAAEAVGYMAGRTRDILDSAEESLR